MVNDDPVNHPAHYTADKSIECIDAMEASLSEEQFIGYLKGQVIKYVWRCDHKNKRKQDIEKAKWYINKLIKTLKE